MGNMPDDLDDKTIQRIELEQDKKFKDSLDSVIIDMLELSMEIEAKSYEFRELPSEIQEKVLDENRNFNIFDDWYINVYEQAEEVGIKVESFDLGRADCCEIEFMEYSLDTANSIIEMWGEKTDIYKLAKQFLNNFSAIDEGENEELEAKFLTDLAKLIKEWLAGELDYLESDEAIINAFEANEYKFDKEGKML